MTYKSSKIFKILLLLIVALVIQVITFPVLLIVDLLVFGKYPNPSDLIKMTVTFIAWLTIPGLIPAKFIYTQNSKISGIVTAIVWPMFMLLILMLFFNFQI